MNNPSTCACVVFIGTIGGLTAVTVAVLWALLKVTRYWISTEDDRVAGLFGRVWKVYSAFLVGVLCIELWPGLANWAVGFWKWIGL